MKTRVRCLLILLIILGWIILALPPYARTVHASTTITFRPPTADNWLQQDNADANMGNSTELDVRSHSGKNCRAIVKFDMSGIIPDGATVISATLSLRYWEYDGTNPSDRTYKVYRLTQTAWTEGGSTWNKYDGTNSWTSLGGDYTTADASSASVPSRTPSWMSWTVTAQVQYAVNNVGKVAHFLIRDQTEDAATQYLAKFHSKEYATPGLRPKLDVTYAVIDRIVFTSAPQVLTAGTPSAIMIIQTRDASGAVNVPSDTTIGLTSTSGTGKFSLLASPWSDITSVTITAGTNSTSFYYKDTTVGTPTITAAESPDKGWTDATQPEKIPSGCIGTAAGNAETCSSVSGGTLSGFTAVSVSSVSTLPPSGYSFPYGLFSFTVSGLSAAQTVTVTMTLSSPLPSGDFSYWKFHGGSWQQIYSSKVSLDSTRKVITLTLTDSATPDDSDGSANGVIVDPGGPAITPAVAPPPTPLPTAITTPVQGGVYWIDQYGNLHPMAWAQVTADDGVSPPIVAYTTDGSYVMWLPPGAYNVTASSGPAFYPKSASVVVSPGSSTSINLILEPTGKPIPELPPWAQPIIVVVTLIITAVGSQRHGTRT